MSGETTITIIGNLVSDPDLRFTPSGAAVANFTVASTPRQFDKNTNEWKDGDAMFLTCDVWREAAENVAETLTKGMRVIVVGRLRQENYEKDGQKRTAFKLSVDEVGPALRYATARVDRKTAQGGGQRQQRQAPRSGGSDPWAAAQPGGAAQSNQDPWGAPGQGRADQEPAPF